MSELTQRLYARMKHTIAASKRMKSSLDPISTDPLSNPNRSARFSFRNIQKFFIERRFFIAGTLLTLSISSALLIHSEQNNQIYKVFIDGKYVGMVHNQNELSTALSNVKNDSLQFKLVPVNSAVVKQFEPLNQDMLMEAGAIPVGIQVNHRTIVTVANVQAAEDVIKNLEQFYLQGQSETSRVAINDPINIVADMNPAATVKSVTEAVHELLRGADVPQTYVVSRGDTLWDIAKKENTTVDKLVDSNPKLADINSLQLGQTLVVNTTVEPYVHVAVEQTVTKDVDVPYTTQYIDDDSLPSGDTKVVQPGQDGLETQTLHIVSVNGKVVKQDVLSRTVKQPAVQAVVKRGTNSGIASGDYIWPISSHLITSPYGEWRGNEMHPGVDIGAPTGTPIWASNNGTVIAAGWDTGGYGICVRIDHGNGVVSIYGHMSRVDVTVGQRVSKGQIIGAVGQTGEATGPHLHYEIHLNGVHVDPSPYM